MDKPSKCFRGLRAVKKSWSIKRFNKYFTRQLLQYRRLRVNKIMSTAHELRNIGFDVGDEWLGTLMLAGLPDNYKPMIMGLESSSIIISSDFIKTKLLQEVKVSEFTAFFTKHRNTSNNNSKPKGKGL